MRPTHRESRSDDIAFDDGFLKSPLNVGESAAHHPDDLQVALWPVHGLGAPRNLKHGVRRNQLCGEPRVRCVDELHEASHELSVCGLHLSPRKCLPGWDAGLGGPPVPAYPYCSSCRRVRHDQSRLPNGEYRTEWVDAARNETHRYRAGPISALGREHTGSRGLLYVGLKTKG